MTPVEKLKRRRKQRRRNRVMDIIYFCCFTVAMLGFISAFVGVWEQEIEQIEIQNTNYIESLEEYKIK